MLSLIGRENAFNRVLGGYRDALGKREDPSLHGPTADERILNETSGVKDQASLS